MNKPFAIVTGAWSGIGLELATADSRDFTDDPDAPWPVRRGG